LCPGGMISGGLECADLRVVCGGNLKARVRMRKGKMTCR